MRGDRQQWMREVLMRRQVMSLLGALVTLKLAQLSLLCRKYSAAQPRDAIGRWVHVGAGSDLAGPTVVVGRAVTGNKKVDDTTDFLEARFVAVLERSGSGRGPGYGTLVHTRFANDVRNANWPGLEVERSFRLGELVPYGMGGSNRTDVLLRGQFGEILAVWDIKTGGATVSRYRADELRRNLGVGADVPVIQIHQLLGSSIKTRLT